MQIELREYQKQNFKALETIIKETRHYDNFSSPKTAIKLVKVFLSSCLITPSNNMPKIVHIP